MRNIRKQPFGYRIEHGEIVLHEREAETVRWIFETYLAGATYGTLVGTLQERGIPYDVGKPWNKNMVARILEDRRYIGEGGFPQILKQEQFDASQVSKQERLPPHYQTPAQKELRRLCGCTPPAWVEGQVLGTLNCLIQNPDMITYKAEAEEGMEISALRRQLEDALHSPPVEEAEIRSMALHLATLRLNAIGTEEYETMRLQSLFRTQNLMSKLDRELLHESVRKVTYTNGVVSVLLKNQHLLKGEAVK